MSGQYLRTSSITQFITPKPQTHLGNVGHINMCCDNSCLGGDLTVLRSGSVYAQLS